jgi:predicted nucleic acid-binding protein
MTTVVDTNVLIYMTDETKPLHEWAVEQFAARQALGPMVVCDMVFAEFSAGMPDVESTRETIADLALERRRYSDAALFLAARAFLQYRANGGNKTNVLPDFLVGALAKAEEASVLTNDAARFETYFPDVPVIKPPPQAADEEIA